MQMLIQTLGMGSLSVTRYRLMLSEWRSASTFFLVFDQRHSDIRLIRKLTQSWNISTIT